MSERPKIIATAHCDKAARENNEDNCLIRMNLLDEKVNHQGDGVFLSESVSLGDKGALFILADGMGGMNAGEVASAIAVSSTSNFFSTQMPEKKLMNDEEIFGFINHAVIYADECIKSEAAKNPECSGLGTTIVVLWILNEKAYIGWCGDSRIYRYNTDSKELERLSHDHSLVQFWVDSGQLSENEAFRHPQSNIIMRSLGDSPETVEFETLKAPLTLHSGDVFLMCSDGLHGMLRDHDIEALLNTAAEKFPPKSIDKWNDMLWEAAENEGWTDNVSSILCHIQGTEPPKGEKASSAKASPSPSPSIPASKTAHRKGRAAIITIIILLLLASAGTAGYLYWKNKCKKDNTVQTFNMPITANTDYNNFMI